MIGKGAFGEVYYGLLADVARQQTPLPVAIKVMHAFYINVKTSISNISVKHIAKCW